MIGVFDSGIGGLTVVKELNRYLPGCRIVYFGDTARLPYGTKSPAAVQRYTKEAIEFLKKRGAKIIVIACNTASVCANAKALSRQYKLPVFEVVGPAIREAVTETKNKKIGVIGTPTTIQSGAYQRQIKKLLPTAKVFVNPAPLLVPLIEEGWLHRKETKSVVRYYIEPLKQKGIDTLILACTHYPMLVRTIQSVAGSRIRIITPAKRLAREIQAYIKSHPALKKSLKRQVKLGRGGLAHRFFTSDRPYNFDKLARQALGRKIAAKQTAL